MSQPLFKLSLRFKLFAAFAIVALTPFLLLAVINGRTTRQNLINEANHALLMVAQEVSREYDDFLQSTQNELALEVGLPVITDYFALPPEQRENSPEEEQLLQFLDTLVQEKEYVQSYGVLNAAGENILDSHAPYQHQSEANLAYFRTIHTAAAENGPFVSAVQYRPDGEKALLFFSQPIVNEAGQTIGFLRVEYDAEVLQAILARQNDVAGEGSFGVLFDEHFIHLAHGIEPAVNFVPIGAFSPDVEAELIAAGRLRPIIDESLYPMQLDELIDGLSQSEANPFFEATDVATGNLVNQVAVFHLDEQPWLVAFFQPQSVFLAPVEDQSQRTALLVAVITGVVVLVSYLFGVILVKPVTSLTETVTQFTAGDLLVRSEIETDDEIGVLATHFNEMAERVAFLLTGLESRTEALEQEAVKHQQTETRLRQQRRFLHQVIDINPSFIFAKDRDGRFVMVNQAFADTYNTTIEDMIGKTDADFNTDPEIVAQFRRDDLLVFESGQELFIPEQKTSGADGEPHWWQTLKRPLLGKDNMVTEVLTIVTEITERKQNEEALRIARDRALEANRVKSEILAKANHELQTPLGAILGYAEMIETGFFGEVTNQQQEIVRKIIQRTNHLAALIQDLLTQAGLETRKSKLAKTTFKPETLLTEMHQFLDAKAEEKGLALTSEIDTGFPEIIFGAQKRIQRILTNLVDNGIKFTEHGFVHVRLYQPDGNSWAIEVSDSGPGIPVEAQQYIFEPFRQVDGSITRVYEGFGLGLSLVKELALTMDGEVSLSSELGKGSTFTISLPYETSMEYIS